MNYHDKLTRNFIFGESWSTEVIYKPDCGYIEYKRKVPPPEEKMPLIYKGAINLQKIRDKLNEEFGNNPKIGRRNKLGEIVVDVASWIRTEIFQIYLYITKQSTTKTGNHPKGIAIDLYTPRGMTPRQFRDFIKKKCNTDFTYYIIYKWGLHADWR